MCKQYSYLHYIYTIKSKTSLSSTNDESQLSGNLNIIQKYADIGYISDATTNPLFVSKDSLSENNEDGRYSTKMNDAISYSIENTNRNDEKETVGLAIEIVTGYISTEVDLR